MATATKKKLRKPGEPSPAQLRARRKFAKIAKERAKEARRKKREAAAALKGKKRAAATKAPKRAVARKPAKRRNQDHPDAKHRVEVTRHWRSGGKESQWQRAHKAGQKQLFAMNPKRKGKNPTSLAKAKAMREEFLGSPTRKVTTIHAPKGSKASGAVALMGRLKAVKIKGRGALNFSRSGALLARTGKNKMVVLGKDYSLKYLSGKRRNPDGLIDLGEITTIEYEATKAHLDGVSTHYYHKMGEEGGARPHAVINEEGLLLIDGGDYDINARGIIN